MQNRMRIKGLPQSIQWQDGNLYFLDQTQIPARIVIEKIESVTDVFNSIKRLKVRGAPAIGIAGAYGLLIGMKPYLGLSLPLFLSELEKTAAYLDSSRPTAVNLRWALKRMVAKAKSAKGLSVMQIYDLLETEAVAIHDEDRNLCRKIGEHGVHLIKEGMGILTHCNPGSLATAELGTATAPLYLAHEAGIFFKVFADETRPLLQGARLTSWELQQAGIDITLICDNMAAYVMSQGLIDMVIVGTDRVVANGDVANKIGTMGVAVLASYFNIPFYVACPFSTIDFATPSGDQIQIEERSPEEVVYFGLKRIAPENIKVRNPAFDVTPHALVTGIITERGILSAPYDESLKEMYNKA
jgi:methylthioribose-1-phosphate isomerase